MITTILLFELTVASHQRMTVKNRCLYSVTSLGSPDTGREEERKPNDWLGPQNGSGDSFPSGEIENKKVSWWTGFVADGTKAKYYGWKKTKNISDTKKPYLQASTKNSMKSINP